MLPSPHLWRRRRVFASEANSVASSNVATVKYQSAARQPRSGLRGYGKWQPIKMAVWGMYAIQICFSLELEGLLRVISLFFIGLEQKKWYYRGWSGPVIWFSGPLSGKVLRDWNTPSHEKIAVGKQCTEMSVLYTWTKGWARGHLWESEEVTRQNRMCTSARWHDCDGMGKGKKKNVRVWFAAVYPDICLRYCHTDLSISLLISISAEVKMEADLQWNKRTKITPAQDAAALSP